MTAATLVLSARNRFERLFDALIDPARRERAMLIVLGNRQEQPGHPQRS